MKPSLTRRTAIGATLLVVGLVMAGCGAGKPVSAGKTITFPTVPTARGSWSYPNGDIANTRDAAASTISSANVSKLAEAWTFKLTGPVTAGVGGYGSLAAGPIVLNGVVYLQDLYSNVYALVLATGRKIWVSNGLLGKGEGTFGIQPQVADGRVYLASQYATGPGGGVLLALNASTGALLWKFNTILGSDQGVQALGAGSGGAWETPLVGSDGSVTYGIGNPYQTAASAIAHPSRQLYTDSDVNLDAATGKLRWYYQGVPNDFRDWDMQASPIAASVDRVPVVIGGGKMGYVYEMNAATGKLIWKTPVGAHNGHDDDSLLALEHKSTLKVPYTFVPGSAGGILTNMALAGNTVYVVTCDLALTVTKLTQVFGSGAHGLATGEVEALDLASGKVEWDTKVPNLPLGAATVSNDLVFTTLYGGVLIALDRKTGAIVYRRRLPTSTNSPIAVAGNTVLVPAGGPTNAITRPIKGGKPQLVAYTAP